MDTSSRQAFSQTPILAPVVQGIAIGLFMMAFFTALWAGIAYGGLQKSGLRFVVFIFALFIFIFAIQGFRLFSASKNYNRQKTPEEGAEGKRMGKWFGIIFGAEGLFIFAAVNIVIRLGYPNLVIPVIALVVGMHFYPMALLFKRSVDYYLATWSTIIAILAIVFSLRGALSLQHVMAFTGIGMALATSAYGFYMLLYAKKLLG